MTLATRDTDTVTRDLPEVETSILGDSTPVDLGTGADVERKRGSSHRLDAGRASA